MSQFLRRCLLMPLSLALLLPAVEAGKKKPGGGGGGCQLSLSVEVADSAFLASDCGVGSLCPYDDGVGNVEAIAGGAKGNATDGFLHIDLMPAKKQKPPYRTMWLDLGTFSNYESPFAGGGAAGTAFAALKIRALDFCQMEVGSTAQIGFWIAIPYHDNSKERLIVDYWLSQGEGQDRCGSPAHVTRVTSGEWTVQSSPDKKACLRLQGINGTLLDGGDCSSGHCVGKDAPFFFRVTEIPPQ